MFPPKDHAACAIGLAMTEFFQMGGHGGFIWPAYGISAVVLGAFLVSTLRRHWKLKKRLDEQPSPQSNDAGR